MNAPLVHRRSISLIRPLRPAWERMRLVLFRPFDVRKWLALGFCSWLAGLSGGESGIRYYGNDKESLHHVERALAHAGETAMQNLALTLSIAAIVVFLVVLVLVVLLWLGSRGEMMFLSGVVRNCGKVASPWREFRRESRTLFRFRLVLSGGGMVLILLFLLLIVLTVQRAPEGLSSARLCSMFFLGGGALTVCAGLLTATILTNHFVVPILYLRRGTCLAAWREMLGLLGRYRIEFILYLLFQIVLGMGVVLSVLLVVICSCCLGAILLMLPVIGAVLLLPITVFLRNYQLLYLAQFGRLYDLLGAEPPALPPR